jgi:hypothetical protein
MDVGDGRGQPLTGWWAIRDRSRCSRRGRGRTWRSSRCRSGQKSQTDCRSDKGSHKWLKSLRDLRSWLARCHGTCSGKSGSNGGDRGARLTKKIYVNGIGRGDEGEAVLIKNHVSRDDQAFCGEIKVVIAFVIREVVKEDTPGRARSKLMMRGCSSVRVTHAAENSEMLIRGCRPKKGNVRTRDLNSLCQKAVQEVCSCVQSFSIITSGREA